jgi:hypothetical protein
MVAMRKHLSRSNPIAPRAELTVLRPGARIAPAKSTWACCQTRLENSGAKGVKTRIISFGRVRIDHLSLSGLVTSVPYPFHSQMAKVQLQALRE